MKKIFSLVLLFISIFSITCCYEDNELKNVKNVISDGLDLTNISDIKMVSKYNDVYVYALLFDDYYEQTETRICFDDIIIYSKQVYAYIGGVYNKQKYNLEQLYYMGLLTKEDLEDVDNKFDIKEDTYEEVESIGHIHKIDEFIITESTCNEKGSKRIFCSICDTIVNEFFLNYTFHNYVNGKCKNCNQEEETIGESNSEIEQSFLEKLKLSSAYSEYEDLNIESCLGVYNNVYIYQITIGKSALLDEFSTYYNIDNYVFINYDAIKIFGFYNGKIYTLDDLYEQRLISINVIESIYGVYKNNKYYNMELVNKILSRQKMIEYVFEEYALKQMPHMNKSMLQISLDSIKKIDDIYVGKVSGLLVTYFDNYVIGECSFSTKQGVICIYQDDKVYNLKNAYEQGIISQKDVQDIYENYN